MTVGEFSMSAVGGECFINPPTWQGVAKQLVHLAQFSGGIQVVDGEGNTGKTVFAHHIEQLLPKDASGGVLALPSGLPTGQVFECLLECLGIEVMDDQTVGESITALRKYDAQLKQDQARKILIVDDAHHLDDQALAALASIFQGSTDSEVGLAMIFMAEPGVAQKLDTLNLVDVEVRDCILPAFSLSEAKELLLAEYESQYSEQDFPLDEEMIAAIWNQAAGKPGEVLQLTQLALEESDEGSLAWWRNIPVLNVVALVVLLLALIWGLLSRDLWVEREEGVEQGTPVSTQLPPQLASTPTNGEKVEASLREKRLDNKAPSELPATPELTQKDMDAFAIATNANSERENAGLKAAEVDASSVDVAHVDIAHVDIVKETVKPAPKPAQPAPSTELSSTKEDSLDTRTPKPAATTKFAPSVAKAKLPKLAPKSSQLETFTSDEKALMRMPKQGYILQVLAASSLQTLKSFVAEQPNRSGLRIYRSIRSGKDWYVVVEGYYADRDSALAAMSNLPSTQLKAGPWPKSMAAVRLEIEAYHQQRP